jgi:hypothetical protein
MRDYTKFSAAMDKVMDTLRASIFDMEQPQNSANNSPQKINDIQQQKRALTDLFTILKNAHADRNTAAGVLRSPSSSQLPVDIIEEFAERINAETDGIRSEQRDLPGLNAAFEKILAEAQGISADLKNEITDYQYKGLGQDDSYSWLEGMKKKLANSDQNEVNEVLGAKKRIIGALQYIDRNNKNITALESAEQTYNARNNTIKNVVNFILQSLDALENMINEK